MDFAEPTLSTYINFSLALLVLPLWYMKMTRGVLFYLYLWQLKEYHIGRFIDHFRTAKGKSLISNKFVLVKLALLILAIPALILLLYVSEAVKSFYDIWKRRLKRPVHTKKTFLLIAVFHIILLFPVGIFFVMLNQGVVAPITSLRTLLVLDLLTPVIVSAVVLGLQPFTVLARNRILSKAKAKRARLQNLKVIGITGSYGKTSTKEFLAHILGQKYTVLKTPEHQNSEVGVAHTILGSLTNEHEVFVCEMGAYNKGGIKLLADIAKPQIGILTGINEQHMATFGSQENIIEAKFELIESLPKDGVAILNEDSVRVKNEKLRIKKYSEKLKKVIWSSSKDVDWKIDVQGKHHMENIALAAAAAKELGMSKEEIVKATETMPMGGMQVKRGVNGVAVIDSIYSANPDGVIADLDYLSLYKGKKVVIMPCLIELGKASKEVHKKIGEKIAQVCDLAIITTKEHFDDIKEGANQSDKVVYMDSVQNILGKIKSFASEGAILMEGGKESAVQRQLLAALKND